MNVVLPRDDRTTPGQMGRPGARRKRHSGVAPAPSNRPSKVKAFANANPEVLLLGRQPASEPVQASFAGPNHWVTAVRPAAPRPPLLAGDDWAVNRLSAKT